MDQLRLVDHGCEVVNGLSELYVMSSSTKRAEYREPLHAIYDSILAKGRNDDGLLYDWYNPKTGEHSETLCDTWGYVLDGFYTMYLVDGTKEYRDAVITALGSLKGKYVGACWGDRSADGFADSIEGAINLANREPIPTLGAWIDSQTRIMWAIQKPDGVIEGWHGDGNFARTSLMYALWKTQGTHVEPWRPDVRLGAVRDGNTLYVTLDADQRWTGKLIFDQPRHRTFLHLPMDYPRINEFPEWFTVAADHSYGIRDMGAGAVGRHAGKELISGIDVSVKPGAGLRLLISTR
jgi:hypothetical protein